MSDQKDRRDDALVFAAVAILWVLITMALLGPVGLTVAGLTMVVALVSGCHIAGGIVIAGLGAVAGILLWGANAWLTEPINTMVMIYRDFLFDGFRWDTQGLWTVFGRMLLNGPAWPYFAPLGIAAGGLYWTTWLVTTGSPLKRVARGESGAKAPLGLLARFAKRRADNANAAIEGGSLLGVDKASGKRVTLSDADANKHTLVLGTTGSGKTVTVLNLVESAINRQLPVIYVDGKGDRDLAERVIAYAESCGRPAYLFAMNGGSCAYNPLSAGGYSAKKDRIVELREWSEDHYRKLAEGYMQTVFKVLDACGITTDLVTVANFMSTARLRKLIEARGKQLADRNDLIREVKEQEVAEKDIESLRAEIRNLARSEIGHLFKTATGGSQATPERDSGSAASTNARVGGSTVLELLRAVEQRAVIYFCLPALQFPALARTLGRLVINDLKSTEIGRAHV